MNLKNNDLNNQHQGQSLKGKEGKRIRKAKRADPRRWQCLLVVIALVASLGFIGPAAAMWGESLSILETVNTGWVQLEFEPTLSCGSSVNAWLGGDQEGKANNQLKLSLNGTPRDTYSYQFTIINTGTIPVKVDPVIKVIEVDSPLVVTCDLKDLELDPKDSTTGTLSIDASKAEPGIYSLNIDLEYIQWNGNLLSLWEWWTDTLHIEGKLSLVEAATGNGGSSSVSSTPQLLDGPDLNFEEANAASSEELAVADQGAASDHLTE